MRNQHPTIVFFVLIICLCRTDQGLCAESIYIWAHEDSEIRITDRPPPLNAKILEIIRYHPQPRESLEDIQKQAQQEKFNREKETAVERAQKAKKKADEARQKAEEAKKTANHAQREADILIDKVGPIRFVRKKYDLEIDRAEALAKETKGLATEAELKAMKAEEHARKAESEALQFTKKPPPADVGEPQKTKSLNEQDSQ